MKQEITKAIALKHIFDNILVNPTTGCWEWQGSKTKDGYGQLSKDNIGKKFGAKGIHRLAKILIDDWEPVSRGEQTRHLCHNRACCNPDHMLTGTAKQNADDKLSNSRSGSKFSGDDIRNIRAERASGVKSRDLAEKYKTTQIYICHIVSRRVRKSD